MISGASQADVGILVIDGEDYQTGLDKGGQTREHTLLLRSLGVTQIICVINKMDRVKYPKIID